MEIIYGRVFRIQSKAIISCSTFPPKNHTDWKIQIRKISSFTKNKTPFRQLFSLKLIFLFKLIPKRKHLIKLCWLCDLAARISSNLSTLLRIMWGKEEEEEEDFACQEEERKAVRKNRMKWKSRAIEFYIQFNKKENNLNKFTNSNLWNGCWLFYGIALCWNTRKHTKKNFKLNKLLKSLSGVLFGMLAFYSVHAENFHWNWLGFWVFRLWLLLSLSANFIIKINAFTIDAIR